MNLGKYQKINRLKVAFIYFLKFYLFLFIWLCQVIVATLGIRFLDQGWNLGFPSLRTQSLHHWTTREVPRQLLFGTIRPSL